jgi:hypothetical protein
MPGLRGKACIDASEWPIMGHWAHLSSSAARAVSIFTHRPDPKMAQRRLGHFLRVITARTPNVSETKAREPQLAPVDYPPEEHLPEPIALTPEQPAVQAETEERDRQRKRDWAAMNKALIDNSMAVMRAMHPWYPREGDRERQIERVMTSYEDGSFLLNRIGAECVLDQDLAVVLLDLRRRLIGEYGDTPVAMMLVDRAVSAYQDFMRVTGWVGNLPRAARPDRGHPSAGL